MTKLIHPKTGIIREVAESNVNKLAILKRAGFVPLEGYRAPKPPEIVADPTLAEAVEDNKVDLKDADTEGSDPEIAIHISSAARALCEKNDLDPEAIVGTGKDGQITKPDVKDYLKALKQWAKEAEKAAKAQEEEKALEEQKSAEDIVTHDDAPEPAEALETAPEDEPEEVEPVGEEVDPSVEDVEPENVEGGSEEVDPPEDEGQVEDFD